MSKRHFILVAALAGMCCGPAMAAVTEQSVRQNIEKTYDVRVLKLVKGTLDGKAVYFVTVMSAGGNDNAAFQVNRLAVDVETGALVSSFRHHSSGYELPAGTLDNETDRQPTDVLRQGWNWR